MDQFELEHIDLTKQMKLDEIINFTLSRHTPMLYILNKYKKGRIEGIASSVYVEYQGNKYIVTVGHTFNHYNYKDVIIYAVNIPLSQEISGIIYLPHKETISSVPNFSEIDYAIFKLSKDFITSMDNIYNSFTISESVNEFIFNSMWNFVFGYCATKNVHKSLSKPFKARYNNLRLPGYFEEIKEYNYHPEINIALSFNIDKVISTENLIRRCFNRAPKPNGLSGCGIWSIPAYPFSEGDYTLLGIVTHYYKNKNLIIGLSIQDIVIAIEKTENELKYHRENLIIFSTAPASHNSA